MALSGIIVDHAYVGWDGGPCVYKGTCGAARYCHAGESPLNDGPVRSTVERQQERIRELEAERLEMGAANVGLLTQIETLKHERDEARARLSNLDILARDISERVGKMMTALDTK